MSNNETFTTTELDLLEMVAEEGYDQGEDRELTLADMVWTISEERNGQGTSEITPFTPAELVAAREILAAF